MEPNAGPAGQVVFCSYASRCLCQYPVKSTLLRFIATAATRLT
jgi:hypothetical protein